MNTAYTISNILLTVVLLAVVVGLLFFTYTSTIEQKVVTSQVDNLVGGFTEDLKLVLPQTSQDALKNVLNKIQPPDMTAEDKSVADANSQLLKKSAIFLGVGLIAGLIVTFAMSLLFRFNFFHIISENIVMMLAVAAVEVLFITFFARQYRSLSGNSVKLSVVESLQTYALS